MEKDMNDMDYCLDYPSIPTPKAKVELRSRRKVGPSKLEILFLILFVVMGTLAFCTITGVFSSSHSRNSQ